jgi:hypothetical protein
MRELVGAKGENDAHAVIWENGQVKLYLISSDPEGWERLIEAKDINDEGEIVGYGIYKGEQTVFFLTPLN